MPKPIEGRDHSEFEHGEEVLQAKPFRHGIRSHWGDCDPARIAYTAVDPGHMKPRIPPAGILAAIKQSILEE